MQAITVLLLLRHGFADENEILSTTTTISPIINSSPVSTLDILFRQARSENYYNPSRYSDIDNPAPLIGASMRSSEPLEHRDTAYYESRCITCDPGKTSASITPANDREYDYHILFIFFSLKIVLILKNFRWLQKNFLPLIYFHPKDQCLLQNF